MKIYRIGRSRSNDITIAGGKVSRRHAEVNIANDGSVTITDLESTNGTFVNGRRIEEPCRLQPGDTVTLGDTPFDWKSLLNRPQPAATPERPRRKVSPAWIIAVAALVLLGIGGWVAYRHFAPKELTAEQISDRYSSAVVMVIAHSGYEVTVDGRPIGEIDRALSDLNYTSFDSSDDVVVGTATATTTGFFIGTDGRIAISRRTVLPFDATAREQRVKSAVIDEVCDRYGIPSIAQLTVMGKMTDDMVKKLESIEVKYRLMSIRVALNGTMAGDERNLLPCTLLKTSPDEELNLAIVQLNSKQMPARVSEPVSVATAVPDATIAAGTSLCAIAFTDEKPAASVALSAVTLSGTATGPCGSYEYGHDIALPAQASGAPIFDKYGRFAGIVVAGADAAHSRAITPSAAAEFLR